jgi:hypothetical protein
MILSKTRPLLDKKLIEKAFLKAIRREQLENVESYLLS